MEGRGRGPWIKTNENSPMAPTWEELGRSLNTKSTLSVFQSDCVLHHVSQQQGVPGKMSVKLKLVTVSLFPSKDAASTGSRLKLIYTEAFTEMKMLRNIC